MKWIQSLWRAAWQRLRAARGSALSYHDVRVTVNGKEYRIADNYAYELSCTRVAGWRLWHRWDDKWTLIGGEYDGNDFHIYAGKTKIV